MTQAAETGVVPNQSTEISTQIDNLFQGKDDLIAGIPGDQFVRRAIADRLTRDISGVVTMVDSYNVGEGDGKKMWVLARVGSPEGTVARCLFIDDNSKGEFGSPALDEECRKALGVVAIGHDERGESYYDSIFFRGK